MSGEATTGRTSRARVRAPLSQETKREIVNLYHGGASRNEIARRLGISGSSVSKVAQAEGLTFPSPMRAEFVEAQTLDVKTRMQDAHLRQLRILELIQERVAGGLEGAQWQTLVKGEGGAEHIVHLSFVPPHELRDIVSALTSAAVALGKLKPLDEGAEAAQSLIESLVAFAGLPPEVGA